ncbi:MAG: hypothetical protein WBA17_07270 [Saprospiraceae bacterium]
MPHYRLLLICCCLPLFAAAAAPPARTALTAKLEVLIPGGTVTARAERAYLESQFTVLFNRLDRAKVNRGNTKKRIRRLRESLEETFRQSDTPRAGLVDLFREGDYNEASAALLYSLVLDHYDIPYAVTIDHWVVRVTAEPEGAKELLNKPTGQKLTALRRKAFAADFVEAVRSLGALTETESLQPTEVLFERYYFSADEPVNWITLAAFMHYRQSLYAFADKNYLGALERIIYAQNLAGRPLFGLMRRAVILQLSAQDDIGSREALYYLLQLYRGQPDDEQLRQALLGRFLSVANGSLLDEQRYVGELDSLYKFLSEGVGSTSPAEQQWQDRLSQVYLFQKARFYSRLGNYERVGEYMGRLYRLRPDDVQVRDAMAGLLTHAIREEYRTNPAGLNARREAMVSAYPFLIQHPSYKDLDLALRASIIRDAFDRDDGSRGEEELRGFETSLARYGTTPRIDLWITTAYAAASNFYFRREDYFTATAYMERATILLPEDSYLAHRLEVLRRY